MKQLVAQPEATTRVIESRLVLFPRTVENTRSIDVLLDQQRKAVIYTRRLHSRWLRYTQIIGLSIIIIVLIVNVNIKFIITARDAMHNAMHSADYAVARCLSVCLFVCLSHAGILSFFF